MIHDAKKKIREYIAHRELREQQVLGALQDGPLEVIEIVKRIYTDVPEFLHKAAAQSMRSHLRKLRNENGLWKHENRWRLN